VANANSTIEIELEIKQALDQLNKLQDELKNSSKGFSQAGKSAQRFERVIKSAMSGVATAMKKSLSIITSFRTALVGLVGVYSASEFVQFGANFEREISKLNALTRATETEQLRLRKAIREVGSSTAFTATQAAAAANVLAALGRTSNQISQELGVVVRVAGATSTAIETVSEAIAAQINVFGESAEQVGNVFAAAYSTSAANVEKLQIALGQVGPVAKSAGLTLTETAGAIAFLIDRGFRAEAAGTALRGTLVRLINPSKAVLEEFQSLGVSFEEIQKLGFQDQMQVLADRLGSVASQAEKNRILTKIFGVEALAAANNLITAFQSGNRVIDNQAEKLRQATDAAGLYKQITSDLRGAIDELISAVQDKLLTAFQAAEPFVKEIVTQLKDAVNSLTTGQIIDAVENIGVILIKGAFGFYDLIRVAINAVYEFLNSPAFQQVIQIAKDSLASLGFTSLDDQISVAEQEVLKQAVLIRELELSKESPFSIDFLTDQTIGAVQEQLDAAKAVLANLKAQKAEQESSLFLIKDRADLEERLIGKIREGAQLIRERAQAQAQLGEVQESQTNQIASSATATVPVLNDISEQLENVKQAGEAAFGILTQQIKDIYSVAFDDDLPILDRVNQIDAFVKSIESSLPQLAGVLEPGQFQAVQTILVDLLNVSDALDKIGQSEAAEAFEKMGREIKKLDPKQQAEFARNLQAQFDQYEQIEEQVNQINERGIERTEVEQINYDYANEIAKVKADQNLTIEQEIKLVNALEDAQQRELDNQEKKLTYLDKVNESLQEQLGLSEGAAAAVISGVSAAGPNASRAMNIAQSKSR
jgi:TP901 family phage tail tape measure protein